MAPQRRHPRVSEVVLSNLLPGVLLLTLQCFIAVKIMSNSTVPNLAFSFFS